jgi:hypothetical protein
MSKTRNKSTTDFASGSGSGSGGTHSGNTGKPDTRIQVDLETATATDAETLLSQGGSFNYKKI